jgi:copper homeostasis protein
MSIVTPGNQPAAEPSALLEVVVLHPQDAIAAHDGGADRLLLLASPESGGRSPEVAAVSAIVRETDLPVRVLLRSAAGIDDFNRLIELGTDYLSLGATGLSFGFLDRDLEVDRDACAELARELGDVAWSFSRDFDSTLEPDRAWRDVLTLPGLDAVTSAGSTRGLLVGADDVIRRASGSPAVAALVLASGGLSPDQVPWLVRAGVRQFGVGASVRQDRSWTKAYVDPAQVRSWRMLLDDSLSRALGIPVD